MNSLATPQPLPQKHYFVDEAGDGVLFSRHGKVIIETEGCSRFFMIGLLDVPDPDDLSAKLISLRHQLLADPYFRGVSSCDPSEKKTALAFHAKDDVPEIRREVFKLLNSYKGLGFYAIITDKRRRVNQARVLRKQDPNYRYKPNDLYDSLVRRLFRDRLRDGGDYSVCFAKRGSSDRTEALRAALVAARQNYNHRWKKTGEVPLAVTSSSPPHNASLQAVDYFLWSVQRLYEKEEDRYLEYLWPAFRLVVDMDDWRKAKYGEYYSQKKPLSLAAFRSRPIAEISGI